MKKILLSLSIFFLPHTAFSATVCGFELNDGEALVVDDGSAYALDNTTADITNMSDDDVKGALNLNGIFLGSVSESDQICLEEQSEGDFLFWPIRFLRCLSGKGLFC